MQWMFHYGRYTEVRKHNAVRCYYRMSWKCQQSSHVWHFAPSVVELTWNVRVAKFENFLFSAIRLFYKIDYHSMRKKQTKCSDNSYWNNSKRSFPPWSQILQRSWLFTWYRLNHLKCLFFLYTTQFLSQPWVFWQLNFMKFVNLLQKK